MDTQKFFLKKILIIIIIVISISLYPILSVNAIEITGINNNTTSVISKTSDNCQRLNDEIQEANTDLKEEVKRADKRIYNVIFFTGFKYGKVHKRQFQKKFIYNCQ